MADDLWAVWWIRAIGYTAFAAFGGAMGHLMRSLDKKEPINWSRTLLESFSAGFVGCIVLLMCSAMKLSEQWTGVIVGVSGWLGASVTIRMLEGIVRKKIGLEGEPPNAPPADPSSP